MNAWSRLRHPNVVKALIWFESSKHEKMYLQMQLADLGTIVDAGGEDTWTFNPNPKVYDYVLNKLRTTEELATFGSECKSDRERVMKFIFCQIAEGLQYLHDIAKVANRDLKPDNMLFTTKEGGTNNALYDRAQITDFTTAIKLPEENPDEHTISDHAGTKVFEAPEVSSTSSFKPKPLDIWALGVSIYVMVFGTAPFGRVGNSAVEFDQELREKAPVFDFEDKPVSDELKTLLAAMLCKDPSQRPTIS